MTEAGAAVPSVEGLRYSKGESSTLAISTQITVTHAK